MLNVGKIEEGFVLDHIPAGRAMYIYKHLGLDKLDCMVAIITNARSQQMGKKDILKVECPIDMLNLDVLAFIDHNITVNVIKDGQIIEKRSSSCRRRSSGFCTATTPAVSPPRSGNFRTSSISPMRNGRYTAANTAT